MGRIAIELDKVQEFNYDKPQINNLHLWEE